MKHTPGPWYWDVTEHGVRLMTPKNGHCVVLDATRRGMQGATVRFSNRPTADLGGVMIPAERLNLDVHPDARLIAASPFLLEACKAALVWLDNITYDRDEGLSQLLSAAIQKAEGEA